jgi:hypothetical protein
MINPKAHFMFVLSYEKHTALPARTIAVLGSQVFASALGSMDDLLQPKETYII